MIQSDQKTNTLLSQAFEALEDHLDQEEETRVGSVALEVGGVVLEEVTLSNWLMDYPFCLYGG